MSLGILTSPPRPRQIVHVGVVGHRPNRISESRLAELPDECSRVLSEVKQLCFQLQDPLVYSSEPLLMRVISPLAEGADRIVAQAGLRLGAELQCPLPFHADEYMLDFADDASKQQFSSLLERASRVFEIDGVRSDEGRAYEHAGQVVIAHSDVVVAIWDGKPGQGRGGTLEMIDAALQQNIPVVWLHAAEAISPVLLVRDKSGMRSSEPIEMLPLRFVGSIQHRTGLPAKSFHLGRTYYAEQRPRLDGGRLFSIFRKVVVKGKLSLGSVLTESYEQRARAEWEDAMPDHPVLHQDTRQFLVEQLCPFYAWADGLSNYYGGLFRSSSVVTNLLAAFAVLFALLGALLENEAEIHRWIGPLVSLLELLLIVVVLSITWWGRRCQWHERWLNYRQLAERLRQYFVLAPLGCALPTPRGQAHLGLDPSESWVGGTCHAIVRDLGLAPAIVDRSYLESMGRLIDKVLEDQVSYHDNNHEDMETLKHRLHLAGTGLFVLTLVACCVDVIGGTIAPHWMPSWMLHWMHLLTIAPPAFGAAFYGITNHGEFARSADRSLAMSRELERCRKDMDDALKTGDAAFTSMRGAATRLAETMIAETLDWNTLFRYRQLNLPG